MEHSHNHNESGNGQSWLFSRTGVATLVALSVIGFLIYEGHGAHLLGYAPFLLILACPLMHIFMHGGHGGHHHGGDEVEKNTPTQQQAENAAQRANYQITNKQDKAKKGGCH